MAVMSVNKKTKRIDLDAGDNLYHLKVTYWFQDESSVYCG